MPSSTSLGRDRLVSSPELKIGPDPRWIALSNFANFFFLYDITSSWRQSNCPILFIYSRIFLASLLLKMKHKRVMRSWRCDQRPSASTGCCDIVTHPSLRSFPLIHQSTWKKTWRRTQIATNNFRACILHKINIKIPSSSFKKGISSFPFGGVEEENS